MIDLLIVGGGVVGLSLAYDSSAAGLSVRVIDRGQPGCEASWAGAGILPPAGDKPTNDPTLELLRLSNRLHAEWSQRLRDESGVDNGFRRCGGLYLAHDAAERDQLEDAARQWHEQGVEVEVLGEAELADIEPALELRANTRCYWLRDEAQLRNPRHLKALLAACSRRGVEISPGVAAEDFRIAAGRIVSVDSTDGPLAAGQVCITSGPWAKALLERLGVSVNMKPVRGQMVLLCEPRPLLRRIVNDGPRYLVPRGDGRVLVGSTEEDAGFDKRTTAEAVSGLLDFAVGTVPRLKAAQFERCWAGLRPATLDGLPYLGPIPGLDNAYVAAGHFRSGLQLSPGTAQVMNQLIQGVTTTIDLRPFRVERE
ncbi:MAG TPA: glycine oxidase ThiO [Pirellulales bacterium]|nr:glycine oxidase ThiO [Pirellulales bacterium]